ncbi:MAG: beta-class carbonic anhydrase [Gaiellaceae bacterium]
MAGDETFADVLAANRGYADRFELAELDGKAGRSLAILTCMDSRIDPLPILGLQPGDAKILRNAGGRVTDDVLGTLVLATYLLGVDRFMVIAHTGCRMAAPSDSVLKEAIRDAGGPDTSDLEFLVAPDQLAALHADVERVRSEPSLAPIRTGGFLYDVKTGRIDHVC